MNSRYLSTLLIVFWLVATACFSVWLTYVRIAAVEKTLYSDGQYLHRLISQRVGQHDAHLTGISVLASSGSEPPLDLLVDLTDTIQKFYPRIESVALISLQKKVPEILFSTDSFKPRYAQSVKDAALASSGVLQVLPINKGYLLVKRSPNTNKARYGLVLEINASKLIESDYSSDRLSSIFIKTKDGRSILTMQSIQKANTTGDFIKPLLFQKQLGSQSQPLLLSFEKNVDIKSIIPLFESVLFAIILAFLLVFIQIFSRQRGQTKSAESRAILGEHEARIEQASRINGLGEMASSIAHELNQPLTAILGQSQAGRRLVEQGPHSNQNVLAVLSAIAKQAKRAGEILSRLRDWSSQEVKPSQAVSLNDVVNGIANLIKSDLKEKQILLTLELCTPTPEVLGDPVQIEQVLFNVVRNSIEAMAGLNESHLLISTKHYENQGVLSVLDTGKGVEPNLLPRLTEPFFSTKPDGMGLGLSLCDRILDRFGGKLDITNHLQGGVCSKITLPLIIKKEAVNK